MANAIYYPQERIANASQQIRKDAQHAMDQHTQTWSQVQAFIDTFPIFMQSSVHSMLDAYQQRLMSSYKTQMMFAQWLDQAHSEMASTDGKISVTFQDFVGQQNSAIS